jgi:formamidopyrimidine-DNA glycosylase
MPELPEMETYRSQVSERITSRQIDGVEVDREKTINVPVQAFIGIVQGSRIERIERRAKMLLFRLDNGSTLLLHLMLGGSMFWGTPEEAAGRNAQVVLSFAGEERRLYFRGLRLGYLHLYQEEELAERLAKLGPDPFDPALSPDLFAKLIVGRGRGMLKSMLVDQSVLAGIGNCYSDEMCFQARIQPLRQVNTLSRRELDALYTAMRSTLIEAIRSGGYMEAPFFVGDTLTGGYNDRCKVYDRKDEPCPRCGAPIIKSEMSGRKVFYCAVCQAGADPRTGAGTEAKDEARRLSHQH